MPAILTTKYSCILCREVDPEPIIFTNTCKCDTVVHASCYNSFLNENNFKCPVCMKATVEKIGINDYSSSYCFPFLFCFFTL